MWFHRNRKASKDDDSVKALCDARENLQRIQRRHPEVREVSSTLKWMRERNHFAETVQAIIEGGNP